MKAQYNRLLSMKHHCGRESDYVPVHERQDQLLKRKTSTFGDLKSKLHICKGNQFM